MLLCRWVDDADYVKAYQGLINDTLLVFGPSVKIFLGCGPMSQTRYFCPLVQKLVEEYTGYGYKGFYLIDFRIEDLPLIGCLAHPNW